MFEHFPYTNMHELNLDWIIEKVKEAYSPENPPENMVLSVNGLTGNVTLYTDAIVKFPTVESDSWNIYRILTGNRAAGIEFAADGTAKIINGVQRNTVYTEANPPTYPVLSVNGQTGTVVLYATQNVKFPDIAETSWNLYRTADGQNLGIKFEKDTALYRINGLNRVMIYDAENQPPYPVTSVNGRTGAVSVQEPFVNTTPAILQVTPDIAGTYWGLKRDTTNGEAGIYFEAVNDTVAAYLTYKADGEAEQTIRLLTLSDIPSSSGVVSVNGKTGVVTLYGNEIYVSSEVGQTLEEALTDLEEVNDTQDTNITNLQTAETNIEKGIAIIVTGDTAAAAIPAGHYAYIKDNTHGLTEGLYTAVAAFPTTGGTADSTAFTPVNDGGLNNVLSGVEAINNKFTAFHPINLSSISSSTSATRNEVRISASGAARFLLLSFSPKTSSPTADAVCLISTNASGVPKTYEIANNGGLNISITNNEIIITNSTTTAAYITLLYLMPNPENISITYYKDGVVVPS